jgi:hypothetical protein
MMVIAQNVQDMIDNCLQFHAQYLGASHCQPVAVTHQPRLHRRTPGATGDPELVAALHCGYDHTRNTALAEPIQMAKYWATTLTWMKSWKRQLLAGLIYNLLDWLTDQIIKVMILIDPQKSSRNSTLDYTVSELPDEILAIVRTYMVQATARLMK